MLLANHDATGQTTIVGEGGSTTVCSRVWLNFGQIGRRTLQRDSFNQSGLTDNGTGAYSFLQTYGNDDYAHLW